MCCLQLSCWERRGKCLTRRRVNARLLCALQFSPDYPLSSSLWHCKQHRFFFIRRSDAYSLVVNIITKITSSSLTSRSLIFVLNCTIEYVTYTWQYYYRYYIVYIHSCTCIIYSDSFSFSSHFQIKIFPDDNFNFNYSCSRCTLFRSVEIFSSNLLNCFL